LAEGGNELLEAVGRRACSKSRRLCSARARSACSRCNCCIRCRLRAKSPSIRRRSILQLEQLA